MGKAHVLLTIEDKAGLQSPLQLTLVDDGYPVLMGLYGSPAARVGRALAYLGGARMSAVPPSGWRGSHG